MRCLKCDEKRSFKQMNTCLRAMFQFCLISKEMSQAHSFHSKTPLYPSFSTTKETFQLWIITNIYCKCRTGWRCRWKYTFHVCFRVNGRTRSERKDGEQALGWRMKKRTNKRMGRRTEERFRINQFFSKKMLLLSSKKFLKQ